MSLVWVVLGTMFQLFLAVFLFVFTAFSGAGIANGDGISSITLALLNLSMVIIPSLCLLSAGIVIYQYTHGGSNISFWWYVMPLVAAGLYIVVIAKL